MRRRTVVARLVAATAALLGVSVTHGTGGPVFDVDVQRYLRAPRGASVEVRAYEEGRRPNAPNVPLKDTAVILVPRSAALLARLAAIKESARDSLANYRGAAVAMRRAREDFERALWEAGAVPLALSSTVDGAGHVSFQSVPAGAWILMAWRSVTLDTHSEKAGRRAHLFTLEGSVEGYRVVSVWMRELTIDATGRQAAELTDRNAWFSGIEEVKRKGAGR